MRGEPFPGTISAVVAQERKRAGLGQRVNVFIGGKFSFALDANLAMDRGLRPGLVLDDFALGELLREDGDARALAGALQFLSFRLRSRSEVEKRLQRDEWPNEVIQRVLAKLERNGVLNDDNFAAAWVDSRSLYRPRGARALQQELRMKGVDKETIEAALPDSDQEQQNAVAAVRRKWENWEGLEDRERRDKAMAFLQRRGFSFSVVRAAVRELEEEE